MSEEQSGAGEQGWQAPGVPPAPQPRYGEYAPGYQVPGYQAPLYAPPQPGWAPPPKPGHIPLRPLSFGTLIGAPFQVLRRNPKVTVGAALLIQGLPQAVVSLLVVGGLTYLFSRVESGSTAADRGALQAGAIGWAILLGIVSLLVSAVSTSLFQGIVVSEVARETLGEKLSLGSLWRLCRSRVWALIGWTLLLSAAYGVGAFVLIIIAVLLFVAGGPLVVVGIVFSVFAALGAVVVVLWISTKLALVPSALVLERLPLGAAIARSWRLTTGFFWKTLGVILLIGVIVYAVTQIITTPIALIGGFLSVLSNPTDLGGSSTDPIAQVVVAQLGINVVTTVVTAIIGAVMAVVQSSAVALIYIDLRMRKEGLDLQLVRFVEARQAGVAGLPDPYQPPVGPPAAAGYQAPPPPPFPR